MSSQSLSIAFHKYMSGLPSQPWNFHMHAILRFGLLILLPPAFALSAYGQTCQGTSLAAIPGQHLLCSANWHFSGTCNSHDQVKSWTAINGTTRPKDWRIYPWENQPISIVGVELVKFSGGPAIYFMVGNAVTPDTMAWLGPNETHAKIMYPAGSGMYFPSRQTENPRDYIDLHGSCVNDGRSGSSAVDLFLTIYYIVSDRDNKSE